MTAADLFRSTARWTTGRNVLLWLALALAPAFSVTAFVTAAHREHQRTLAREWDARGQIALENGQPAFAVEAFRNAMRFSPDDRDLRLRLAESLGAADRPAEARAYYSIVLPVMISNAMAYLVSRHYQPDGIFDVSARQDGIQLPSMEHQREAIVRRVEDAMRPPPIVLPRDLAVGDAVRLAEESQAVELLAHVRPNVWGLAPLDALKALSEEGKGELAVGSVLALVDPLPVVHPDEPLEVALAALGGRSLIPVVHRAEPGRLVGVIGTDDILRAYRG